jgi:hypothetical protein
MALSPGEKGVEGYERVGICGHTCGIVHLSARMEFKPLLTPISSADVTVTMYVAKFYT